MQGSVQQSSTSTESCPRRKNISSLLPRSTGYDSFAQPQKTPSVLWGNTDRCWPSTPASTIIQLVEWRGVAGITRPVSRSQSTCEEEEGSTDKGGGRSTKGGSSRKGNALSRSTNAEDSQSPKDECKPIAGNAGRPRRGWAISAIDRQVDGSSSSSGSCRVARKRFFGEEAWSTERRRRRAEVAIIDRSRSYRSTQWPCCSVSAWITIVRVGDLQPHAHPSTWRAAWTSGRRRSSHVWNQGASSKRTEPSTHHNTTTSTALSGAKQPRHLTTSII
jgi:hypothetical protein